jgi:hypothetical protein
VSLLQRRIRIDTVSRKAGIFFALILLFCASGVSAQDETGLREATPNDPGPLETVPGESVPHEAVPGESVPHESRPYNAPPHNAPPQTDPPQNSDRSDFNHGNSARNESEADTPEQIDDEVLRLLTENALSVHIVARILQGSDELIWNMDLSRVTISGRAVKVRLDGANLVVVAQFTPYKGENDEVLLVAQGQTWVLSDDGSGESVRYATAFESLPMRLGDTILFYPLGRPEEGELGRIEMDVETEKYGFFTIELEIRVAPFSENGSNTPATGIPESIEQEP